MSIRTRLLLLVLLATLPLTIAAVGHFVVQREESAETAQASLAIRARAIAQDLEDRIRATAQLLYGLSRARDLETTDRDACSAFLARTLAEYPQYTGLLTILPDGNLFCDSLRTGRELYLLDRGYFKKAQTTKATVSVEPTFGRLTGIAVMQVAFAARAVNGDLRFVVLASFNLENYMAATSATPRFANTVFLLTDAKGTVLTRHPVVEGLAGTSIAGTPLFKLAAELPTDAIGEDSTFDGLERVWAVDRLPPAREAGLSILVGVPKTDLTAAADRNLLVALAAIALMAFLVFGGTWLVAERSIRRPIGRVARLMDRLAARHLSERIDEPRLPRGELGALMRTANSTADALEAQARTSRALTLRLTALIESSPAAIICLDAAGKVTLWNPAAEQMFGYAAEAVLGMPPPHLPPDGSEAFAEAHARAMRGAVVENGEGIARTADGRALDIAYRVAPLVGSDGQARETVFVISDITERLALEGQLRQSQKLQAVGQLTGGVAHDFNNLLTVILGNAETLAETLAGDPQSRSLAEMTRNAALRGAELTRSLLAFARKQPLQPRATNIDALLAPMEGLLRRTLGEHIEIRLVLGSGRRLAFVDRTQLEAALLNLAVNARDAMPEGGRLTIETGDAALDADYAEQNPGAAPGDYVVVAVTDTGTGMSADVISRAFEPFFTTKEVGRGSGLGLSMVYGFVKQSGGHVKIYSEVGHGTVVKLYLPASGEPLAAAETAKEAPRRGGSESILVVEDDQLVRQYVEGLLRGLGYAVTAVGDGAAALAQLRGPRRYDLLFTDVVMPGGLNGPALAREAVALRPHLKVLFTSGYTENAIVHHGRLDAGVQLISKPYRRGEIAAKLREILGDGGTRA